MRSPRRLAPAAVADRLHSAAIHVLRRVRAQDVRSGLSPARLSALSVIVFGGPVTLGRLAEAEQVSAPTMTRLVAGLEDDGLLQRQADPADKRVVWVRATARGTAILEEGRRRRIEVLAQALAGLAADELAEVDRAVAHINRALALAGAPAAPRARLDSRAR